MMRNTADNDNNNDTSFSPDIQPYTPPPGGAQHNSFKDDDVHTPPSFATLPNFEYHHQHHQPNPRKKRTKLIRLDGSTCTTSTGVAKPKYSKKPDPSAPKITRPCSECGKKFWSWKALFGHMRCHPERQWRGINPPPNFRKTTASASSQSYLVSSDDYDAKITQQDHEVASCLLMLANGPGAANYSHDQSPSVTTAGTVLSQGMLETTSSDIIVAALGGGEDVEGVGNWIASNYRFECSSCKKVFSSRQALGGHRASHKNVKGCFAITRTNNDGAEEEDGNIGGGSNRDDDHDSLVLHCRGGGEGGGEVVKASTSVGEEDNKMQVMVLGGGHHQCSICLRVFSSGQALGGHKRCHWEKLVDEPAGLIMHQQPKSFASNNDDHDHNHDQGCQGTPDLNLPASVDDDDSQYCSYNSSGLALDLRLGL